MLSRPTAQLVEEIFAHFGEEAKQKAKEDPEAYLISMLLVIKKELPLVYATLRATIERARYESYLKEAKRQQEQVA